MLEYDVQLVAYTDGDHIVSVACIFHGLVLRRGSEQGFHQEVRISFYCDRKLIPCRSKRSGWLPMFFINRTKDPNSDNISG